MKNILFAASALFLALSTATADASQSFVAFGLTNVTLGQAIFSSGAGIPVVTNLSTNGVDGLSVLLGEADSGAFLYVNTAAYPEDGDYMIGKAYGNLGGLDEQLICTVRARRMDGGTGFGVYPVAVDFTPLGATNLLFQVFSGKRLVAQATHAGGEAVVRTDFNGYRVTRVNPYWRFDNAGAGALFEFEGSTGFNFPDTFVFGGSEGIPFGNRLFVRPLNPTNVVEFLSRIDVTSGGEPRVQGEEGVIVGDGLATFELDDVRLGIFGHAHEAIDAKSLVASGGRLTVSGFSYDPGADEKGVSIELEQASRINIGLLPVQLATNGAALSVSALGLLSQGNYGAYEPSFFVGSARVVNNQGILEVRGNLPGVETNAPRIQIAVYSNGFFIGSSPPMDQVPVVTLSGQSRITGLRGFANTLATRAGLGILFESGVIFAATNQSDSIRWGGDEIRILMLDPAQLFNGYTSFFDALTALNVTGAALPSLTITEETEERPASPLLSMTRSNGDVVLSWLDPNAKYLLQSAESLSDGFIQAAESNNSNSVATVRLNLETNSNRFFRLVHSGFLNDLF